MLKNVGMTVSTHYTFSFKWGSGDDSGKHHIGTRCSMYANAGMTALVTGGVRWWPCTNKNPITIDVGMVIIVACEHLLSFSSYFSFHHPCLCLHTAPYFYGMSSFHPLVKRCYTCFIMYRLVTYCERLRGLESEWEVMDYTIVTNHEESKPRSHL